MSDLPKLLYDKDEAAQILSVPKTSIDWLLRKGTLPRRKIAGKIRFTLDDLQVFVEASKEDNCCNPVLRGDKKGA
ncbi:MAG: helix-turn-helix domain-containing protein [Planctomycetes bacterium]|nr:helix-turn-helix domain-containing protein [Planctomycetota bacterium]